MRTAVASPDSGPWRLSPVGALSLGGALLVTALLLGATQGAYAMDAGRLWAALQEAWAAWWSLAGPDSPTLAGANPSADRRVLFEVRAPRLALGLLCGASLGAGGALIQGLLRNPLADPGLIGTSSGAAFGAALAIVAGPAWWPGLPARLGDWPLLLAAFGCGLAATGMVSAISRVDGQARLTVLLLAGIAVNALTAAGIGWLSAVATDAQLRALNFWLLGSLGAARWDAVGLIALLVLPALALMLSLGRDLNVMALGEPQARLLGVAVERTKRLAVLSVALAVGATTALTGGVGFIGLVAPHLVRLTAGPDHRLLLPASAVLGGALVIAADTVARTAWAPAELPLGVLTACIGVPVFLSLLWAQRGRL